MFFVVEGLLLAQRASHREGSNVTLLGTNHNMWRKIIKRLVFGSTPSNYITLLLLFNIDTTLSDSGFLRFFLS